MALAVRCQLDPQVRPFVPTTMAPRLAYRRRKREEGEELVSNHQVCSGNGRWVGRHEVGRLNPPRETSSKGKNGDRGKEGHEKKHKKEEMLSAQTEAARQSRAAPRATERNKESSTCA